MAAHVHLKNEFMEDEKYHNLMIWLKYEHCSPDGLPGMNLTSWVDVDGYMNGRKVIEAKLTNNWCIDNYHIHDCQDIRLQMFAGMVFHHFGIDDNQGFNISLSG